MLHRRQPLRTVRAAPVARRVNMLTQRPVSTRGSWMAVVPVPFYLDATMFGGRLEYDIPITPIE